MEAALDPVRVDRANQPWTLAAAVAAATSIMVGLLWDISWHATIGRDSFWTPAHMAIYLGGVLAGLSAGYLALHTTFAGTPEERAVAVRIWGFSAPLGAWVSIWGTFAMLTSAPFDDWWHNAYGLDVQIISPPHVVLAAGIMAIQIGTMMQVLAVQNRAGDQPGGALGYLYAYAAGLLLVASSTLVLEYSEPNRQHGALFYQISAVYLLPLIAAARAARVRWPATTTALFYLAVRLGILWVLPLFPAQPRLAPIWNPVTHMWPTFFPPLLIVPAFAVDLLLRRFGHARKGLLALGLGAAFLAVLLAVQWPFAELMLTPHAHNWFFAGDQWTYRSRPGAWQYRFWNESDPLSAAGLAVALLLATVAARLGLARGDWMARVRR